MGERSEPKWIDRRNALALFGYAAAFGLVASPAILMASQARAQTSTTPATPPTETPKTGTERRQERRTGRTERRQERRTGRTDRPRSGAQGAISDVTRAMVLPNRRSRSMPVTG